jgi:hypothetical protein
MRVPIDFNGGEVEKTFLEIRLVRVVRVVVQDLSCS